MRVRLVARDVCCALYCGREKKAARTIKFEIIMVLWRENGDAYWCGSVCMWYSTHEQFGICEHERIAVPIRWWLPIYREVWLI